MKVTTVKEIKDFFERELALFPDDMPATIAGGQLSLYRSKMRGENCLDIEFNEVFTVTHDPDLV